MSFEVFVMRFAGGEAVPLDQDVVRQVLDPYVTARDAEGLELAVETPDGGQADVVLRDDCVTFHRFGGAGVMDLVSALLRRLEAVLIVPGGPFLVHRAEDWAHAPSEGPVVVAPDGGALLRAIRAS